MTASGNSERFQYFDFETDFLENKTFFKKLEYHYLVESTKIENLSFPYKTASSEINVKTSKMVSTKWAYHKERRFASNYFIFLKNLFQLKNLLWKVDLMYKRQMPIFVLFVSGGVLFDGAFSLWVSLNGDTEIPIFRTDLTEAVDAAYVISLIVNKNIWL